jgi:hypothetical protein
MDSGFHGKKPLVQREARCGTQPGFRFQCTRSVRLKLTTLRDEWNIEGWPVLVFPQHGGLNLRVSATHIRQSLCIPLKLPDEKILPPADNQITEALAKRER